MSSNRFINEKHPKASLAHRGKQLLIDRHSPKSSSSTSHSYKAFMANPATVATKTPASAAAPDSKKLADQFASKYPRPRVTFTLANPQPHSLMEVRHVVKKPSM